MACCILLAGLFAIFIALQTKVLGKNMDVSNALKWRLKKRDRHEPAL